MIPYTHQEELSDIALAILKQYAIVYLGMEERTGKTLISILTCEKANIKTVLVITKKKALDGWYETLSKFKHSKVYHVTNYHQAKNCEFDADIVILDEAHNYISSVPKRPLMNKEISRLTKEKPIIYISATPYAQGPHLLFHQLSLSSWSPWKNYKNYYSWHKDYGIEKTIYISGIQIKQWTYTQEEKVLKDIQHLFITKTRKELNFKHEPKDVIHTIKLNPWTKDKFNRLMTDKILTLPTGEDIVADTIMKLRVSAHMLEGGVAKLEDKYFVLPNREKVEYILENWGDSKNLVIMYNYKAEGIKLASEFGKATLLQATSNAEGIDLSMFDNLVIYSQDFSTARHTQRRARQANKNRDTIINVHYLIVPHAISDQVYKTVSINKTNYVDAMYNSILLK